MTQLQIFNRYFKNKLIIWVTFAIIATILRYFKSHDVSILKFIIAVIIAVFVALILGFFDYNRYEKELAKKVKSLLATSPLSDFISYGFWQEDNDKIVGQINNYKITLSPTIDNSGQKFLIIMIPLKTQENLEGYINKDFDENFKLKLSTEIFFARAVLKNYDKLFNSIQLKTLLDNTIKSLQDKEIMPIEVIDE